MNHCRTILPPAPANDDFDPDAHVRTAMLRSLAAKGEFRMLRSLLKDFRRLRLTHYYYEPIK